MYDDYQKEINRMFVNEKFFEIKQKENANRKVPISDDILYASDFIFEPYANKGDSGLLYLATSKKDKNEKYIIKHEYLDCACNEYMYSKVSNKMGIKTVPVKLFIIDDKQELFKSPFVCGIKYLENCERIGGKNILSNKENIKNWQDFFKMCALEVIFDEDDGIEVVKYNNKIYRIDATGSFILSHFIIDYLAYDFAKYNINIRDDITNHILKIANVDINNRRNMWKIYLNSFIKKYGRTYLPEYLETFNLLDNITDSDIEMWTNILTWFYPNIIGKYYKEYFKKLKSDAKIILKEIYEKELIEINKKD